MDATGWWLQDRWKAQCPACWRSSLGALSAWKTKQQMDLKILDCVLLDSVLLPSNAHLVHLSSFSLTVSTFLSPEASAPLDNVPWQLLLAELSASVCRALWKWKKIHLVNASMGWKQTALSTQPRQLLQFPKPSKTSRGLKMSSGWALGFSSYFPPQLWKMKDIERYFTKRKSGKCKDIHWGSFLSPSPPPSALPEQGRGWEIWSPSCSWHRHGCCARTRHSCSVPAVPPGFLVCISAFPNPHHFWKD